MGSPNSKYEKESKHMQHFKRCLQRKRSLLDTGNSVANFDTLLIVNHNVCSVIIISNNNNNTDNYWHEEYWVDDMKNLLFKYVEEQGK